jgi:hypothetical protein
MFYIVCSTFYGNKSAVVIEVCNYYGGGYPRLEFQIEPSPFLVRALSLTSAIAMCNYKKKRLGKRDIYPESRCRKTSVCALLAAHFSTPKTATSDCSSQIIGNNYENRAPRAPVKVSAL